MPPQRTQDRTRPRQDPVSCQLCRTKKLKCDRQRPRCSNCASRRQTCEYSTEGTLAPVSASADIPGILEDENFDSLRAENRTLKARLQRLEHAVFGDSTRGTENETQIGAMAASTPSQHARAKFEGDNANEDSLWLERIGTRIDVVSPQFTDPVLLNISTLEDFLTTDQRPSQLRRIDLPTQQTAITALNAYAEHLDAVQHIMHVESTRRAIDGVYQQMQAGMKPDPGVLVLILSICANVGFYWTVGFHRDTSLFEDSASATKVAMEWAKQALFAVEQARIATTTTSLEAIQGSIMLLFLFYHVEGFTFRVRLLHMTAITMAKDMGLHTVDAPSHKPVDYTQAAIIDREVRRKIWWHLSCTDWLLSFLGGPWEGMYSIHPSQMHVQLPRNLTREDLDTQGPEFSRSLSEPTVMAYYLQRIKMATTCREIADALWAVSNPETVDYELVKTLDARFETQIQDFPRFLRIDIPSKQLRAEFQEAYDQQVDIQGAMVNLMIHTRRCKLHLPFLIRAKQNPRFAFSRRMGVQSARAVFSVRRFVIDDESSMCADHFKLGGMLQHIFFATVALVMDLCVNNDGSDPTQLAEVREALSVMQESKEPSGRGAKFYDSLIAVLRKHHVKLPNPQRQRNAALPHDARQSIGSTGSLSHESNFYSGNTNSTYASNHAEISALPYPDTNGTYIDDGVMWQDFLDHGTTLHLQDWEELLTDLDMRMG